MPTASAARRPFRRTGTRSLTMAACMTRTTIGHTCIHSAAGTHQDCSLPSPTAPCDSFRMPSRRRSIGLSPPSMAAKRPWIRSEDALVVSGPSAVVFWQSQRSWRLISRVAFCGIVCAGIFGCSSGGTKLTPVAGKVTVDGAPLATGSVTFHPDAAKGNNTPHIPVGSLDAQGNYKLVSATKDGAPLGWYKVTVSAQEPIDPKNPYAPPKHLINPKFSDASTSGLEIEVVVSPPAGAYDIKLAK